MSDNTDPRRKKVIAKYIDENLKKVFSEYSNDEMPTELTDLLSVLKAQDQQLDEK